MNTYEVTFEKNEYEPNKYRISIETSNFRCYRELKNQIGSIISQYELKESIIADDLSNKN